MGTDSLSPDDVAVPALACNLALGVGDAQRRFALDAALCRVDNRPAFEPRRRVRLPAVTFITSQDPFSDRMILTCPSCATRYVVDPKAIGASGRTVRCARCHKSWHQDVPDDLPPPRLTRPPEFFSEPEPEAPPPVMPSLSSSYEDRPAFDPFAEDEEDEPAADPMPSFMARPEPIGGDRHLPALHSPKPKISKFMIGWAALVLILVLLVAGLWFARSPLVAVWPPLERLYTLAGIQVDAPSFGLEIRNLTPAFSKIDNTPTLVVAGEVANTSGGVRKVPALRVSLKNAKGDVLKTWDFTIGRDELLAGETAPFQTSISTPPADASSAVVVFVDGAPG